MFSHIRDDKRLSDIGIRKRFCKEICLLASLAMCLMERIVLLILCRVCDRWTLPFFYIRRIEEEERDIRRGKQPSEHHAGGHRHAHLHL